MPLTIRRAPASVTISDTITVAEVLRLPRKRRSRHIGSYGTRLWEKI